MKKMLAILASFGLTATAGLSVVACGKANSQFNTLMDYVNETKGSYNEDGTPKSKSSASVIVIGAKDNGSSQSFQYALEKTFDSLDLAKAALNKETEVNKTSTHTFNNKEIKVIKDETGAIVETSISLSAAEMQDLKDSRDIKVEFKGQFFDATISGNDADGYRVILQANSGIKENQSGEVKLTGYKYGNNTEGGSITNAWATAYWGWLAEKNPDRSVQDLDVNLDTSSKVFGKVTGKKNTPVYGIKSNSEKTGVLTNALDYAKIKFSLKTLMVDKVADYWNNDLFKKLTDDYFKSDLMYQLTANNNPPGGDKDFSHLTRQTKINDYISEIKKAKGPLFLIVKNGHLIKMMKGWTRYEKFGNKSGNDNEDTYRNNLIAWINEIGQILNNSFIDNNPGLFDIDGQTTSIKTWDFAAGENQDDAGASNWDPEKKVATD